MSNLSVLLGALIILAACRPPFEPVSPERCASRPQPSSCGPGCQIVRQEEGRVARPLAKAPLDLTREVSLTGFRPIAPTPPGTPSLARDTNPLTLDELLAVSGEEVLFRAGSAIAALDAASGEVTRIATTNDLSFRWAHGPAGGFFVMSGRRLAPSAPGHLAQALQLPSAPTLTLLPSRLPVPTQLASGTIYLPTSTGLFAFQPSASKPLSLLALGAFTSVALLGSDLYASRCEPLAASTLEATVVVGPNSHCDLLRAPVGTSTFVTVASLAGVVELTVVGDRLLARSLLTLTSFDRRGAQTTLYAVTRDSDELPPKDQLIGPFEPANEMPAFRLGRCVVTLDDERGTVTHELGDAFELEAGGVHLSALPTTP